MPAQLSSTSIQKSAGFLSRLRQDCAGNTLALAAAALFPMLALVGSGIDLGRAYLSQSRLQQACDAGVLAARKRIGTGARDGEIADDAAETGERFFNINFQDGAYGTENRDFEMILHEDFTVAGEATLKVRTSIMAIFGFTDIPVAVQCEAKLSMANTDVMMVLDTTGSMMERLPGDSVLKIEALRQVVRTFYDQMEASKTAGTRLRYGFVPYSVNVNVGFLLKSDWVVDNWTYNGRKTTPTGLTLLVPQYSYRTETVEGTHEIDAAFRDSYCPSNEAERILIKHSPGTDKEVWRYHLNGTMYGCDRVNQNWIDVTPTKYNNYVYDYIKEKTGEILRPSYAWRYGAMPFDVSFLNGKTGDDVLRSGQFSVEMDGLPDDPKKLDASFNGCIEERATYSIDDYDNVDLTRALDLDIDLVPDPGDTATQWRPIFPQISYLRSLDWFGGGSFTPASVTSENDFANAYLGGFSACPSPAHKLSPISAGDLDKYLKKLAPAGNTYHDIGMIWGGRLLSATGLFAHENADLPGAAPTTRNLIFLTDGQTAPRDVSYGAYGIEPLDRRRWSPGSPFSLTQVVENRFMAACKEVKKRNITVWVVGFGIEMTEMLKECAGDGHWFQADDAGELAQVFSTIANSMGDLRVTR